MNHVVDVLNACHCIVANWIKVIARGDFMEGTLLNGHYTGHLSRGTTCVAILIAEEEESCLIYSLLGFYLVIF